MGYVFNVSGAMKRDNCELKTIKINIDSCKLTAGTYILGKSIRGKYAAGYDYYKDCVTYVSEYYTSVIDTGMVVIKKFDESSNIVSGTFWFNAAISTSQVVQVRERRFDMKFTR